MKNKEEFKILSPRDHVRKRIQMYMGSASAEQFDRFVMGKWQTVKYVPALSKMIDEIIDNSIDEAIRTKFKKATVIDVSVKGDLITITDNGRGIPQDEVEDTQTGKKILRPVAAWTRVNAGTSFDDERVTIGTNGLGSAATNFLSTKFIGQTWQSGKLVEVRCSDGGLNIDVQQSVKSGSGTKVSFKPDFSLLETESVDEFDTVALIQDRLSSLQMAFPEIRFSFNNKKILTPDLKKYSAMFVGDEGSVVLSKSDDLSFFFVASEDGFRSNSYINGVNTRQGGSYVDFIVNGVVDELTSMVKRKHKIEVSKSTIKNGLTFIMFARNFENPKFDSQTKERLTSTAGSVKAHYEAAGAKDFTYLARKIMAAPDIIDPIIEAQLAKKLAADKRAATIAQKKLKKVKVAKHIAASSDKAMLFIVEGDSASGSFLEVRDPAMAGAYPLRGVIMNTWDMVPSKILENKELSELVAVLGLNINDPDSVDDMQYAKIATLTDADHDGIGHISPLLIAFFYRFWPRLFEEQRVHMTRSPIMISTKGTDTKWFYSYDEANEFKNSSKGYKHRYIKGLAGLEVDEYSKVVNEPVLDVIAVDDASVFDMMFGSDAELRKGFMTQ